MIREDIKPAKLALTRLSLSLLGTTSNYFFLIEDRSFKVSNERFATTENCERMLKFWASYYN